MGRPGSLVGTSAATTSPAVHAPSRTATSRPDPAPDPAGPDVSVVPSARRARPDRPGAQRTRIRTALAAASTAIATSIAPPRSETAKSLTVSDQGLRSSFTSR